MRILIVSEGEHELGGALRTLVGRVLTREFVADQKTVRDPAFRTHGMKGKGHFKKAVRCLLWAEEHGYDALVFVIDQDDEVDRRRQLGNAQAYERVGLPRAMGIAIRTFDAWMLADEMALSAVLSRTLQRQPDPETIDRPKDVCVELLNAAGLDLPLSECYARLAARLDLDILEKRCPDGFATFAQRLRRL